MRKRILKKDIIAVSKIWHKRHRLDEKAHKIASKYDEIKFYAVCCVYDMKQLHTGRRKK